MLELFGTVAGNILSLPGVLGFGLGLLTRRIWLAAAMGALIGAFETLIFADFSVAQISSFELGISVVVGVVAGMFGCLIRRRGATV